MESPLNLTELERIITSLSNEHKIAGMSQHSLTDPDRDVAKLVMKLCVELLTVKNPEQFADFESLRRELYATQQFMQFYTIVQDNEKREKLIEVVKRVYHQRHDEFVATIKPRLMETAIAQMNGMEFQTYLEIIGIIKPLWAK